MHGPRRKMKVAGTIMTVNIFLFIVLEVSRSGGQGKGGDSKLHVPSKRFWARLAPSTGFWNREQQKLDLLHNPVVTNTSAGVTSGGVLPFDLLPDWLNDTLGLEACEPDPRVAVQLKDYNQLPQRFKDFLSYLRCRSYPMVVDQPHICQDGPFLLLAIKSLMPHFDRRQAIRESWGRAGLLANRTVATVFLLGNATAGDHFPDLSAMLQYESAQHRDLLQWDYRDTFFNLTVKEVLFQHWVDTSCPQVSFIFKGDDDVFVNTPRILDFLKGLPPAKARDLFIGDVITHAGPHRDKRVKYYIPETMFVGMYPPYAGGGGYLYSGDLARRLHAVSHQVALYPIDDVYTGMCLRKLGLAPEKHKGFRTFDVEEKFRGNPCTYKGLMLVHPRTPQDMIKIWGWLNDPKLKCQ
ncbi:N-acetyllactosaminide beta-1,3-N-acetylglucosaminyltransferase 2 [Clupea harengus]|uniref:Hexosyltransferase n=1 Tax=Clupea harengus TaxID=7950 RepID=A0A6P8G575_CLUHA|nr:N-acetyllactosaminide beta-1,3-N-acetylglucosaminyltransferase 2 [Clupea harengus]XP_042565550.1 N-acetyllactosaminide beta-1,3-N-acetylglucosaminyltransferase 2 [Clupea harengus]